MTEPRQHIVVAHQADPEHHTLCPICGAMVDELDLNEVLAHLDPDHAGTVRQVAVSGPKSGRDR